MEAGPHSHIRPPILQVHLGQATRYRQDPRTQLQRGQRVEIELPLAHAYRPARRGMSGEEVWRCIAWSRWRTL